VFHDDGAGTFNPAPEALDEAVVNEWPGRDVGVFVSVGTGKRPKTSDANQHMWYEGFLGEFAEARRRLIAKIEGSEKIHEHMVKEHLAKRNVNIENYYRFNVEIGVGEFGMNEWHRLADISTSTRRYLGREQEQKMIQGASAKLAKINSAIKRLERVMNVPELIKTTTENEMPFAVELPGEIPANWPAPHPVSPSRSSYESGSDNLQVPTGNSPSPRSSGERLHTPTAPDQSPPPPGHPRSPHAPQLPPRQSPRVDDSDLLAVTAPTPAQYRNASGADKIAITSADEHSRHGGRPAHGQPHRIEPPPLPPKTPLLEQQQARTSGRGALPYPVDDEGPPPAVNMARKPDIRGR
jgi:hypothetical protein